MPNEMETSLRNAAETISKYIADVATLTVETRYVEVGNSGTVNFDQALPAAWKFINQVLEELDRNKT